MQLLILFELIRKCIHIISRFNARNTLNLLRNALYNSFFFKFHQLKCLLFQTTGTLTLTLRYKPRTAATQFPVLAELSLSLNLTLFPSVTPKNSLRKKTRVQFVRAQNQNWRAGTRLESIFLRTQTDNQPPQLEPHGSLHLLKLKTKR